MHTIATGGNLIGASEIGIKTGLVKIGNFIICSILGGLAGMLDCFRIGSIDPLAGGTEIMFMAIASAVIGGTLLTGGSGTIVGAFLGAVRPRIFEGRVHPFRRQCGSAARSRLQATSWSLVFHGGLGYYRNLSRTEGEYDVVIFERMRMLVEPVSNNDSSIREIDKLDLPLRESDVP